MIVAPATMMVYDYLAQLRVLLLYLLIKKHTSNNQRWARAIFAVVR
jgi:hypothetical protein